MAKNLRPLEIFPITTRFLQVIRTADVTPGMRRITLGGEQLKAHTADNGYPVAEFRSDGFDDEFKVLIDRPDSKESVGPTQLDGVLNWPRGEGAKLIRTYTVRRWDPEAGELDVDFVNHGVGPATSWARNVKVGETVQIAGPKSSSTHPENADWVLVGADETALPAVGRWLEEWPQGARGQVFIEVEEESHRQDLVVPEGVELTWLVRRGAEAGTTTLLFDALKAAEWWEGTVFSWVAGEAGTLTPIRRWLRNEKKLDKDQIEVTGYWKKQKVTVTAENPELPDPTVHEDVREVFHELAEIMPGFALRVAATLDFGPIFGASELTLEELANQTGATQVGLFKLLRYLKSIDVAEQIDTGWKLTELGRELDNDYVIEDLHLDGYFAQRELAAISALLGAVKEGTPIAFEETQAHTDQRVEAETGFAGYVSGALAADSSFTDLKSIAIFGRGAKAFASAIHDKYPDTKIRIVASQAEIHAITSQEELPASITLNTNFDEVDAVLVIEALNNRSDFESVALLKEAATHGRVYYFARALNPSTAHDHDFEDDLSYFALNGGSYRSVEDLDKLFKESGLGIPQRRTIGWGATLHEFEA